MKNKFDQEMIYINNKTIKAIGDMNTGVIGEYSIVFGSQAEKDFHGNWFTKNTFRGHNRDGASDVAFLNHRVPMFKKGQFDPEMEKALKKINDMRFKNPVITTVDEIGEFSKLVLDLDDKYEKMVFELAKQGAFKWSSGTGPQGYKALPTGELEMFVVFEKSLTPIPAEYRMLEHRVMPLKAYTDFIESSNFTGDYHMKTKKTFDMGAFIKSYSNGISNFLGAMKYDGPGPHENGSSQDVHGNGGGGRIPKKGGNQSKFKEVSNAYQSKLASGERKMNSRQVKQSMEDLSDVAFEMSAVEEDWFSSEDEAAKFSRYQTNVDDQLTEAEDYIRSGDNQRALQYIENAHDLILEMDKMIHDNGLT